MAGFEEFLGDYHTDLKGGGNNFWDIHSVSRKRKKGLVEGSGGDLVSSRLVMA